MYPEELCAVDRTIPGPGPGLENTEDIDCYIYPHLDIASLHTSLCILSEHLFQCEKNQNQHCVPRNNPAYLANEKTRTLYCSVENFCIDQGLCDALLMRRYHTLGLMTRTYPVCHLFSKQGNYGFQIQHRYTPPELCQTSFVGRWSQYRSPE